ncbi:MAG: hypothetical protein IIV04_00980 [Bacteroidaceae bacterium]|nr:hypothetical protein [Bacteroidaceae bacterium]
MYPRYVNRNVPTIGMLATNRGNRRNNSTTVANGNSKPRREQQVRTTSGNSNSRREQQVRTTSGNS